MQTNKIINQFNCRSKSINDFTVDFKGQEKIDVIEALDGQLITNHLLLAPKIIHQSIVSDVEQDVLKIVVVNRYQDAPVAKAFIKTLIDVCASAIFCSKLPVKFGICLILFP